jgi:hypothetical protein
VNPNPTRRVDPHLVFGISLFAALVLSWPSLAGAMHGRVDIVDAGVHLLVAVAVSWAGCYMVGSLVYGYAQSVAQTGPTPVAATTATAPALDTPQRRATDVAASAIATAGAISDGTDESFAAIDAA